MAQNWSSPTKYRLVVGTQPYDNIESGISDWARDCMRMQEGIKPWFFDSICTVSRFALKMIALHRAAARRAPRAARAAAIKHLKRGVGLLHAVRTLSIKLPMVGFYIKQHAVIQNLHTALDIISKVASDYKVCTSIMASWVLLSVASENARPERQGGATCSDGRRPSQVLRSDQIRRSANMEPRGDCHANYDEARSHKIRSNGTSNNG